MKSIRKEILDKISKSLNSPELWNVASEKFSLQKGNVKLLFPQSDLGIYEKKGNTWEVMYIFLPSGIFSKVARIVRKCDQIYYNKKFEKIGDLIGDLLENDNIKTEGQLSIVEDDRRTV